MQDSEDLLKRALEDQLNGEVFTKAPRFFEADNIPVASPQSLRNVGTVTLREKLFGYKTLNCLQPSKIFPQFGEYYPITLQDYRLSFQLNSSARHLFKHSQTTGIGTDVEIGKVLVAHPTRVYVRSRDSEVQSDKELIKANFFYPEIERFQTVTSHVGEVVATPMAKVQIKCVTGSRLPDYFFFYVERITADLGVYEHECPKIESIKIKRNSQATRIYTGGTITKYDLYDCTRRNSHPRADLEELFREYGGVLLSKFDVGTLLSSQLATFRLDLEFEIELAREPNNEDVLSINQGFLDVLDAGALANGNVEQEITAQRAAADARYLERIVYDTQTTVLFIYENGSNLVGEPRKLVFKKTMV
jgi:hypothetical protein